MLKFVNQLNSKGKNNLYHSQQTDGTASTMSRSVLISSTMT
ncbi:unnamed protein product [Debaryomyces tyrocola]|nr:unnamed protein product [Debaryomyces tyrocola]